MRRAIVVVGVIALAEPSADAFQPSYTVVQGTQSVYVPANTRKEILKAEANLTEPAKLFVNSDGSFAPNPYEVDAVGSVYIEIENHNPKAFPKFRRVSNTAVIGWDRGYNPGSQHSFNVLGVPLLDAGNYTVRLWAEPLPNSKGNYRSFFVSTETNLSVMLPGAQVADEVMLDSDTPDPSLGWFDIDPDLLFIPGFADDNPEPRDPLVFDEKLHFPFLSYDAQFDGQTPWIALGSASIVQSRRAPPTVFEPIEGDAMLGLYVAGKACGVHYATWTVNDITHIAETAAPMSTQGFFAPYPPDYADYGDQPQPPCDAFLGTPDKRIISFDATKMPVVPGNPKNMISYNVNAGARLVVLSGGMQVLGREPLGHDVNNPSDYLQIGEIHALDIVIHQTLAETTVVVPQGHSGIVFFAAKGRGLGYSQPGEFGVIYLWIEIDGTPQLCPSRFGCRVSHRMSTKAIQQTVTESQRTLSASYLAAGADALRPGYIYTVRVIAAASGNYAHAAMSADLPLIWFDDAGPNKCRPYCVGRTCVSDGCGGVCGSCECVPRCQHLCGSNGCGGYCGTCPRDGICTADGCIFATPR